ncbi:hypothetical protein [Vreelandella boliviensis]|uniref:hypothetical protein n=1 Tax=Vreelandella boliviensis TaxID=223527 RepID=UPI001B8D4713|nr:hypothetical protein [Halomonas boliviensis]MBS3670185.1 hypothetical protein [Halomonas boliviensis]
MIVNDITFHREYADVSDMDNADQHVVIGTSIRATVSLGHPFGNYAISIEVDDQYQLTCQEAHDLICCEMRERILALAVKEQVI